jgi:septal ring factor EnvC (AmiA/AmiB activator)
MTFATRIAASALAASLALGIAVPASAAAWNAPGQLRQQIAQLDNKLDRAEARRTISHREAQRLDLQVDQLRLQFRNYARGGFTRYELASLDRRVDQLERQLAVQARSYDDRVEAGRYNRYDGPRHR